VPNLKTAIKIAKAINHGEKGECCRPPVPFVVADVPAFSAGEGKNPVIKASDNPNRCGNYGQEQSKPEQRNEPTQPL
jgi:hypothetical protein